jgi:hypothetical protein
MSNNLTQPDEVEFFMEEHYDLDAESERENTTPLKSKLSKQANDDEYYIPLYKTNIFN